MFAHRTEWDLTTNAFTKAVESARALRKDLIDLTASNPTTAGFVYSPALLQSLASPAALSYDPDPNGLLVARNAVCSYYASLGVTVRPADLFLTVSTSEAYSYCFRLLCGPGDEVLIARPSYPLFEFLAQIQDVNLATFPLIYDHGWQVDFHSLEQAITSRTRAIIVVHPNNPTGSYVKREEMERLSALCAARGIAIIADEVFFDFNLTTVEQRSFTTQSRALTFTLSGLSKISGLPQMKLAWLAVTGPEALVQQAAQRLEVIADTYLSPSAPVQHAAAAMLDSRHDFQLQVRRRITRNLAELDSQLSSTPACSRLDLEAGWSAILRVPRTRTDEQLALALIERCGVIVHPGHFFDFEEEGHLVLSLLTPEDIFALGVKRVFEFLSAAH